MTGRKERVENPAQHPAQSLFRQELRFEIALVLETEAQGFPEWTPYPGQLRLQAFSHLASGANMVGYWHWGSTANAFETYWRGLLSQDNQPNPTYDEAGTIGRDLARLGPELLNMRKQNRIAIYVSNRALTAFNAFKFGWSSLRGRTLWIRPKRAGFFLPQVGWTSGGQRLDTAGTGPEGTPCATSADGW